MPHLSIVIPSYKCSAAIPELVQRLEKALPEISEDHEIISVNDGSPEKVLIIDSGDIIFDASKVPAICGDEYMVKHANWLVFL